MNEMNVHIVFVVQVPRKVLRAINRAVLTAGTTESDLQMRETAFQEPLYMMIHQLVNALQERQYFAVLLQKVNNGLVQTRHLLKFLIFARVMGRAAVKNITASVAGLVRRNAALIREGVNRD